MKKWSAISFVQGDLYKIGVFFKQFFNGIGNYGSMGLFHWKINENPFKKGIINLVKDGDRIAATTSVTPKKVWINGESHLGAEIGDTYTDPAYQRQGMFALLVNETRRNANEKGAQFVYGTPNSQSLPGYQKKANFDVIPGNDLRQYAFPLILTSFLRKKRIPWLLCSLINILYRSFLKLKAFAFKWSDLKVKLVRVQDISLFEEEYSSFWNSVKSDYDFILDRSARVLQWRFFYSPGNYRFTFVKKDKEIIGYFVTREIIDLEQSRFVLADFLFKKDSKREFLMVLRKVIRDALETTRYDLVDTWVMSGSFYESAIREIGFVNRSKINIICHINDFSKELRQSYKWHFTISDSDNI